MVEALLSRLRHYCHTVHIKGPSEKVHRCASRKFEEDIVDEAEGRQAIHLEKHGRGVEQAWRMLDLFASLGVHAFDLTHTDIDGQKRGFRRAVGFEALHCGVPHLLDSAIQRQRNLIVRPQCALVELVQLDDLSGTMLERLKAAAFLILATSVGNHQAWVALPECGAEFARRVRQGSGADPSASGATRVAGSLNFKRQYAPDFPTVRLLEGTPQRTVTHRNASRTRSSRSGRRAASDGGEPPRSDLVRPARQSMAQL